MQEDFNKYGERAIERKVLTIYMIFVVLLFVTQVLVYGNASFIIWTFPEVVTCWVVYFVGIKDKKARAYIYTSMALVSFFGYGVAASSLFSLLPSFGVLLVLTGLFNIPGLLGMVSALAMLLAAYHAFVVQSFDITGRDALVNSLQQLIPMFIMIYLVWFLIKKDFIMNKMLLETIETLRQAEHSKDEFMANVSHEIRTPLNTICGMSELSLREELPPGIRENLFDIQVAGRNLQAIVSDVLDFSELETGKLAIVEESYNFTSILNDVLNIAIAQNEEKKLEIVVNYDVNLPCGLVGDSEKIRRIFSGLVNNAIKFTEKGCVTISVSGRKEDYGINLCVNVKDTGIGMSQEGVEKLLTNFSQADTRKNRQQTGMGLGIAITRKITDMMNGFLSIKSEEGAGSEFQFVIPQKIDDEKPVIELKDSANIKAACYINQEKYGMAEIRDSYMDCIKNIARQLELDFTTCQNLPELKRRIERRHFTHLFITVDEYREDQVFFEKLAGDINVIIFINREEDIGISGAFLRIYKPFYVLSVVTALNGGKMVQRIDGSHYMVHKFTAPDASVLVVDDNVMNLKVMEGLLRPYKVKFYTAGGGSEALVMLDRMYFDLVFMDHMMPGMDGVETLHHIRGKNGKFFQKVPVVALTANAIGGAREMFLSEGFQDFVAKPVEVSTLERVLKKFIPEERIIIKTAEETEAEEAIYRNSGINGEEAAVNSNAVIDIQMGISYSGGVYEDYIDVIRLYYKSGLEKRKQMQELFEACEWNDYTIMVHALKSTSLGIGAKELSEMAKEQEKAGKENNTEYLLANHNQLMDAYDRVLSEIASNKEFIPEENDNTAEGLSGIDRNLLMERLAGLAEALDTFEEDTVMPVINELSLYSYNGQKLSDKLEEVSGLVQSFDFCGAADALEKIRKEWEDA
ncbi:MAG: response regulator [Lachnospiraceae bacterium]|nr:response regulator [Lachnospiraceae bacterium]